MNAHDVIYDDSIEVEFKARPVRSATFKPSGQRKSFSRQRGKSPQQFNGIHRRRTKKIRW